MMPSDVNGCIFFLEVPVVPKKATCLFENSRKNNSLTSLVSRFLNCRCFNLNFGILQSKIGCKFKSLWLLEVQICEKVKTRRHFFLQKNSNFQIRKKGNYFTEIYSLKFIIF